MLSDARAVAGSAQERGAIAALKIAEDAINAVPDPTAGKKLFATYMRKHGSALNKQVKDAAKVRACSSR